MNKVNFPNTGVCVTLLSPVIIWF